MAFANRWAVGAAAVGTVGELLGSSVVYPTNLSVQNPSDSPTHFYIAPAYSAPVSQMTLIANTPRTTALIDGRTVQFGSIEEKIDALAEVWRKFCRGRSVIEYNHAAYMQVIGIGIEAMPILLKKLEDGDSDWIVAMKYIAGTTTTTPEMRGDVQTIRQSWLDWGTANGFWQRLR
jgi:hypothetical protein